MIRVIVVILLVLGGLVGYVYYTTGSLPTTPQAFVQSFTTATAEFEQPDLSQLSSLQMPSLPENTAEQLGTFEERASSVSASIGTVLGTAVQQASGSGSIQDKAFQYGRYLYCQQVVTEYEAEVRN